MAENKTFDPGALLDTRPEVEKQQDFKFEEVVAYAAPVQWRKKRASEIRKYPIFDQGQSGSCVAQTARKLLGVYMQEKTGVFVKLSAADIYQRRSNRPESGMIGIDAFKIMQKGTTLLEFGQDDRLSDTQMDAVKISDFERSIGKSFAIGNYLTVPTGDIDTIASIIQQTGKAVMVWFYFGTGEWTKQPVVKNSSLTAHSGAASRHSVSAVDFTLTEDGKKALIIDDSWGPTAGNGAGQRTITEDFFSRRNFFNGHFMTFAFEEGVPPVLDTKPRYRFSRDLAFTTIVTADPDVVALQNVLKYEGLFPANTDSTGYFGAITRIAVGKFQLKHGIVLSENDPGFGKVGPRTRAIINSIYA
jgi:hypothetical protein